MIPDVVQVVPFDDFTVDVYFADGKIVSYNAKSMLEKPVFKALNDVDLFKMSCVIINHTLAWDIEGNRNPRECIDIAPDTLYALPKVSERIA